jgi:predicted transcriptional regulator
MSRRVLLSFLFFVMVVLAQTAFPQNAEISIGEVSLDKLHWGEQKAVFEITNYTDYLKFIKVITEITFEGTYLNPSRERTQNFILEPFQTRTIDPAFNVPPNFGKAKMLLRIYDVVDTLDELLPSQLVMEQPFYVNFRIPDGLTDYLQNKLSMPAMVGRSPAFDNEFSRILLLLLYQGKSVEEIAKMAETSDDIVQEAIDRIVGYGFLNRKDSEITFRFPMIGVPESEEVKKLAEDVSDQLVTMVQKNLPVYLKVVDSLVAAKAVPADTNYFLHGGTLLHFEYPMVAGLLFWYDLAQEFIDPLRPLDIFANTDPCHAKIINYMYALEGGDFFNGTNFYNLSMSRNHLVVTYGDTIPMIVCTPGFTGMRNLMENSGWWYSDKMPPETFMMDTSLVHIGLRALRGGSDNILKNGQKKLKEIVTKYDQDRYQTNTRYWFWNLTTTRALDKLIKQGILKRRGNGLYRFEKMRG